MGFFADLVASYLFEKSSTLLKWTHTTVYIEMTVWWCSRERREYKKLRIGLKIFIIQWTR